MQTASTTLSLRQLFYVSRAARSLTSREIEAILHRSRRNNRARDVTGCLMFTGQHFAQTLEGAPADLTALYNRILTDPRHTGCVVIVDRQTQRRRYPEWSMGYLYKLDLVDRLEGLLAGPAPSPEAALAAMDAMSTDSVMGAL